MRDGPQLKSGDCLANRYELLSQLGSGGFGTVWKAYDEYSEQVVALKVLHGQYCDSAERRDRFRRGAKYMRMLSHPNIVRILEPYAEDAGYHFFIMEYLDGGTLYEFVIDGHGGAERSLDFILAIGGALQFAHDKGIIHRDVTPDNILLNRPRDTAKLTDFDLVRVPESTGGTRTGSLGRFVYAAPECLESAPSVDARSDLFSLGMTTVFCLYGKRLPHEALFQPNSFIDSLNASDSVRRVLRTAVSHAIEARFRSAQDFCEGLRKALTAGKVETRLGNETLDEDTDTYFPKDASVIVGGGREIQAIPGYRDIALIGQGGDSTVYRAVDGRLERIVALKAPNIQRPDQMRRVRREGEVIGRLQHPSIVSLYGVEDLDGLPVLCMEYVEGRSLAELVRSDQLDVGTIVSIIRRVAEALGYAHDCGILHRDIKPSNILIDSDGNPKIIDFGIATRMDQEPITGTGEIVGTLAYLSPELAIGERATIATEVYSLGATLFFALTGGQAPFQGTTLLETLYLIQQGDHPRARELNPQVPHDLDGVCAKCMAMNPRDRYPSMRDLSRDLTAVLELRPVIAVPPTMARLVQHWIRKNPWRALALCFLFALLGVSTALTIVLLRL
jgi:serine/threonine protein kinase